MRKILIVGILGLLIGSVSAAVPDRICPGVAATMKGDVVTYQFGAVTVASNGRVTIAKGAKLDKASREFWASVQHVGMAMACPVKSKR